MITAVSTTIDMPVSDPRAVIDALDFVDISEFTAELNASPRVDSFSSVSGSSCCVLDGQTVVVIVVS